MMWNRNAKNVRVCGARLQLCCDVLICLPPYLPHFHPPFLSPLSTGQRNPCFGETMHTAEPEPSPHGTARTQHLSTASRWHGDILWCKQDASLCNDMKAHARLQGCRQESGEHCLMLKEKNPLVANFSGSRIVFGVKRYCFSSQLNQAPILHLLSHSA